VTLRCVSSIANPEGASFEIVETHELPLSTLIVVEAEEERSADERLHWKKQNEHTVLQED
jgi:hypothetical protein